jgi:hypothetical protein
MVAHSYAANFREFHFGAVGNVRVRRVVENSYSLQRFRWTLT